MSALTPRAGRDDKAILFGMLVDRVVDYAIFLHTPDGQVASWNAGARRLKGYEASEIIGHSFERFYTPDDRIANCPDRLTSLVEDQGTTVSFWLPAGDVDQ